MTILFRKKKVLTRAGTTLKRKEASTVVSSERVLTRSEKLTKGQVDAEYYIFSQQFNQRKADSAFIYFLEREWQANFKTKDFPYGRDIVDIHVMIGYKILYDGYVKNKLPFTQKFLHNYKASQELITDPSAVKNFTENSRMAFNCQSKKGVLPMAAKKKTTNKKTVAKKVPAKKVLKKKTVAKKVPEKKVVAKKTVEKRPAGDNKKESVVSIIMRHLLKRKMSDKEIYAEVKAVHGNSKGQIGHVAIYRSRYNRANPDVKPINEIGAGGIVKAPGSRKPNPVAKKAPAKKTAQGKTVLKRKPGLLSRNK